VRTAYSRFFSRLGQPRIIFGYQMRRILSIGQSDTPKFYSFVNGFATGGARGAEPD